MTRTHTNFPKQYKTDFFSFPENKTYNNVLWRCLQIVKRVCRKKHFGVGDNYDMSRLGLPPSCTYTTHTSRGP